MLELRQAELAEYVGSLREPGLSPRSQARHVHSLRGFYRFAVREGLVERDPMENLRPPKAFRAAAALPDAAQVEALLGVAADGRRRSACATARCSR